MSILNPTNTIPPLQATSISAPAPSNGVTKKKNKKKNKSSQPQPQQSDQQQKQQQPAAVAPREKRDERSKKQPNPFKGIKPPQRAASSSPEKMKKVLRQPHLRLPQQQQHHGDDCSVAAQKRKGIDGGGDSHVPATAASTQPRFRNRADTTPNNNETGIESQRVDVDINRRKIEFRGPSSRSRASTHVPVLHPPTLNPISYAAIRTGSSLDVVPPRFQRPLQRQLTISPKHSPIKETCDTADVSPTTDISSGSDPDCECNSCTSETSSVPNFTKLFRPRYPPDNPAEFFNSPVPRVFNYEHGLAIREELTKFHAGVYLVDELVGEDEGLRIDGLRKVVDKCMPMLRWLGIEPQNIVFFYHGRGESEMGFDVWDAIKDWEARQRQIRYQEKMASGARTGAAGSLMEVNCRQDVLGQKEQKEQKERSKELCKQTVVDSDEDFRNKKGTKKWMAFAEFQRLNGLEP